MNAADLEVLWNRIAIRQAQSARLVDTWLGPPTTGSSASVLADRVADDPDAPTTESHSETAGLGYRPAQDALMEPRAAGAHEAGGTVAAPPRRALSSNERLRSLLLGSQKSAGPRGRGSAAGARPTERLLGSEAALRSSEAGAGIPGAGRRGVGAEMAKRGGGAQGAGRGKRPAQMPEAESDEELGRSAIGKKKKGKG